MTIKEVKTPIVCDTAGCGNLAEYELVFLTGQKHLLCKKCFAELKAAINKEKIDVGKSKDCADV